MDPTPGSTEDPLATRYKPAVLIVTDAPTTCSALASDTSERLVGTGAVAAVRSQSEDRLRAACGNSPYRREYVF
jgi:hypothetical protein